MTGDTVITGIRSIRMPSLGGLTVTVDGVVGSAVFAAARALPGVGPALVAVTWPTYRPGPELLDPRGPDQFADRHQLPKSRPLSWAGARNSTVHRPPRPARGPEAPR